MIGSADTAFSDGGDRQIPRSLVGGVGIGRYRVLWSGGWGSADTAFSGRGGGDRQIPRSLVGGDRQILLSLILVGAALHKLPDGSKLLQGFNDVGLQNSVH